MNKNDIIIFTGKSDSWDFDDSACSKYDLIIGEEYVISEITRGDWSEHVRLVGQGNNWYVTSFFQTKGMKENI